jgi:hypothetical protein
LTDQTIDILSFDAVSDAEAGYDLALKNADGTDTGIVLRIIGSHSDAVVRWAQRIGNQVMREQVMAAKRGKPVEPRPLEELREQNIEGAAIRVVGWSGVKQEFSADLMRQALRRNPHWVDQIVRESDDLGNFTGKHSAK